MTIEKSLHGFDKAFELLRSAKGAAVAKARQPVLDAAAQLMDSDAGMSALAERAQHFDAAGLFQDGPWADASKLLPGLVRGGLLAEGPTAIIEVLSELRVLSIAGGAVAHPTMTAEAAAEFLNHVTVQNLVFLDPGGTEDARLRPAAYARGARLVNLLVERLSSETVLTSLVDEIDALCAQRPILTTRIRDLIARAQLLLPAPKLAPSVAARLERYRLATTEPSLLSQRAPSAHQYLDALRSADEDTLRTEADALQRAMHETGLGNPYHALLLRHLSVHHPALIVDALGLEALGSAGLEAHLGLVQQLIDVAIHPETADSIYGLVGVLQRALLARRAVALGLQRLMTLQLQPAATKQLQAGAGSASNVSANARLVAGVLSLLGQPLGVGQGPNPTCQTARGLSLWSVHAAGYLLNMLISAARDGTLSLEFEGVPIESATIAHGVAPTIEGDLDPVSRVLVPHLDRIYDEMMRRAAGRGVDGHRWVNPAFYGRWVPRGFGCAIDVLTGTVREYDAFVRLFFANHHPSFNDGDELIYPNPVGAFVTDVHGNLLGAHAVSLRRVDPDPAGELRAYFFNPNNEGRQDWGLGVVTSVHGRGEIPGESSLPFAQFASRLYAFHYHPNEGGAPEAVPDDAVAEVVEAARTSWGRAYPWA